MVHNTPYKLSKNYDVLFKKVNSGLLILGFSKSDEKSNEMHIMGIVKIDTEHGINYKIGNMDRGFSSMIHFYQENDTVKNAFIRMCKFYQVKWIVS